MITRLKGRVSLLLLAFAVVMLIFPAMAFAQDAGGTSPAPTIQSDLADYPPGATVTLTGANWQPGESVHIFVNDDEGRSWSRDVDVTADESGNIRDQFQLPDWFVATYSVKATGTQSGEATTSFTDAAVQLQGKSKQVCVPKSANDKQCEGGYESVNLSGWQELDEIPLRLKFTGTGTYTVNVDFDHFKSSDKSPGVQDLYGWTAGTGVQLTKAPVLTKSTGDVWTYTLEAKVTTADAVVNFKGNLAAGAHYFTGSSLALSADNGAGTLQIAKPSAAPGSPDLAVNKTGPTSAGRDEIITYTLNYQNKSSAASGATGVQLTDILPSGVTYVAGSCSGTCTVAGNEVTWNLGSLAKGDSGSRTIQVRIPANAAFGTEYVNNARILSAENDANLGDNTSSLKTTVSFNRAPSAVNDSLTTDEDTAGAVNVLANDTDPDGDTLTVTDNTAPQKGSVTRNGGSFTYTPNKDFNGTDSFFYTVSDGKGGTATAKVTITVNAVNDEPSFNKGADYASNEDAPAQSVSGWASAISAGPNESSQNVSFVVTNDNNPLFSAQPAVAPDGTLTYKSDADKNGSATVTVKAKDDGGTPNDPSDDLASGEQTFTITVRPVNDAPSFKMGADQAVNEDADPQAVASFATEISKGPADESGQSVSFIRTNNTNSALFSAQPEISADGTLTYTPAANASGEAIVSFKIRDNGGTDDGGVNESAAQSFKITVNPVNDDPVAKDDSATTDEDNSIASIEVLGNDSDVDGDSLTVSETSAASYGTVTINNDGQTLKYEPKANFNGTDSFTYTVSDGKGGTATAGVTITVNAVNDAPVAKDDTATTPEDTPVVILAADLFQNDSAGPTNESGQKLTITEVSNVTHGQASINGEGNVVFTPAANFVGKASFDYTVCDDGGTANGGQNCFQGTATVKVTVSAVNDAPVAKPDSETTSEDTAKNIDVLANDTDVEKDSLTAVKVSDPAHGTVSAGPNGTLTYTPSKDFNGSDSFTYKANDGDLDSEVVEVTVTVTPVNDEPQAVYDAYSVDEDRTLTLAKPGVLGNDTDVDGDSLTAAQVTGTAHGELTLNADGSLTYKPNGDYHGTDSFSYKANDGEADSNVAMVDITVKPVNDPPVISMVAADPTSVNEGSPATIRVTATDPDNGASDLRYSFDCDNAGGFEKGPQAADNATCTFDDNGTYRVTVEVSDGHGGSATASTTVTVKNVAPTLTGPISVSPQRALVGQKVTFTAPDPVDPSQADRTAGFTWNWYANDASTPFLTGLGLNPLVSSQFSANKCGTYNVSATATDKDSGVSNAAKADASVSVSNGLFRAPLVDGTTNLVQKGQVVPVKVFVGCGTTNLTGLTPSIQLLKGNVTPEDETQSTTVTTSVSSADTEGWMRPIDGGYIYNLRVPDAAANSEFTIRVNPFGTTATPNPAGSQMYSLIKIRK